MGPCIEEPERQAAELGLDVRAQGVDRLLRDAGHQVLLQVLKERAHDIQDEQPGEDVADVGEVDAALGAPASRDM